MNHFVIQRKTGKIHSAYPMSTSKLRMQSVGSAQLYLVLTAPDYVELGQMSYLEQVRLLTAEFKRTVPAMAGHSAVRPMLLQLLQDTSRDLGDTASHEPADGAYKLEHKARPQRAGVCANVWGICDTFFTEFPDVNLNTEWTNLQVKMVEACETAGVIHATAVSQVRRYTNAYREIGRHE